MDSPAKYGKCATCGMDVTRKTTYQFPEEFGQKANTYVFCCYDCMTAWLYRHMCKSVYVREGETQTELGNTDKAEETDKNGGGWF